MPIFAVHYTYAPELASARDENRTVHRSWLKDRIDEGKVLTTGPYVDGTGALIMITAPSLQEAESLMSQDPHNLKGLVTDVTVIEWQPVMGVFA